MSIIKTKLNNYAFTSLTNGNNSIIDIDNEITNYFLKVKEDKIIVEGYLEIDCSNSTYIGSGNRGILSIIDNHVNKVLLIDLLNN